ncbi:MAG: anti-sigma factor family protein [Planctomycetota bacterium]|jgi:hypothetical protein
MTDKQQHSADCTDIKALLSALIDDEVDATERYRAERHLAECQECRELVSAAERNDALVAAAVAREDLPGTLPKGFETAVWRGAAGNSRPGTRSWVAWLGWFTAAAAVLLAAAVWRFDRPPAATGPVAVDPAPTRSVWIRPIVNEVAQYPIDTPAPVTPVPVLANPGPSSSWGDEPGEAAPRPTISRADAEALESVSLLLATLRQCDDDFAPIERAREVIAYDELLPRLWAARSNLPAEDQAPLFAAESLLFRIVHGRVSLADVRDMRRTISHLSLPQQLDAISGRFANGTSL